MTQVFSKEWFAQHQRLLVLFANTSWGRQVLRINDGRKVWAIMPNALYFLDNRDQVTAEFRGHDKYGKRLFYEFEGFWKFCHEFDMRLANRFVPALNLGFDTLTAYPVAGAASPCDGPINRVGRNETFATLVSSAGNQGGLEGTATDNMAGIQASTTTDQYQGLRRGFFNFDTSSLTSGATVSAVTFSLWGVFKSNNLGDTNVDCVSHTAGSSSLPNTDFVNIGSTSFAGISIATIATGSYNDFVLNSSGISNINKTGISKYAVRLGWDRAASFTGTWVSNAETRFGGSFADTAATTQDPKLTVTFTLGGGGGVNYGVALLLNLV